MAPTGKAAVLEEPRNNEQRYLIRKIPLCPVHQVPMRVYASRPYTDGRGVEKLTQYCRCPRADCSERGQCHPFFE